MGCSVLASGVGTREALDRAAYIASMNEPRSFTARQLLFKELFVGTLIYTVVLGFFDDYTSIVEARSFSYVFMGAIVLEVLTCGAFAVKGAIVASLRHRESRAATAVMRWACGS
jgi:hypothetical protein